MGDVIGALRRFALVLSTLAGLCAGGAVAATVSAATHGAGTAAPAPSACTEDPLDVTYAVRYSARLGGDAVTGVTVTDTASQPDLARCAGSGYSVTLRDAAGRSLATVRGTVPAAVSEFASAGFPTEVAASRVIGASLTLGR